MTSFCILKFLRISYISSSSYKIIKIILNIKIESTTSTLEFITFYTLLLHNHDVKLSIKNMNKFYFDLHSVLC